MLLSIIVTPPMSLIEGGRGREGEIKGERKGEREGDLST